MEEGEGKGKGVRKEESKRWRGRKGKKTECPSSDKLALGLWSLLPSPFALRQPP